MTRGAMKVAPGGAPVLRRASSCSNLHKLNGLNLESIFQDTNPETTENQRHESLISTQERLSNDSQPVRRKSGLNVYDLHDEDITILDERKEQDDTSRLSKLMDRHLQKHSLKKLFSLPNIVNNVLEKRKKNQETTDTPMLEGRPSSPLAILDAPELPTPPKQIKSQWTRTSPDFQRCKFAVWRGGVPGFQLGYAANSEGLVVDTITGPFAWTEGIRVGDILESIGSVTVADLDPHAAMAMLHMSDIPTVLRLRAEVAPPTERYTVILHENEKLGVTFASDGLEAIPVVNRITDRSDTLARSGGIACGHVLLTVNEVDAISTGLGKCMQDIAHLPKPLTLQFRRLAREFQNQPLPPTLALSPRSSARFSTFLSSRDTNERDSASRFSVSPTTIDESRAEIFIVWRTGSLGLTFVECPQTGLAMVNRLTGKGRTPSIERVQHGYTLLSINGSPMQPHTFSATCGLLTTVEKPCLLLFKPPSFPAEQSSLQTSPIASVNDRETTAKPATHQTLRRGPHATANEYEVLWEKSPLGLVLGFEKNELPFVKRMKSDCSLRIKRSITGDALVAVNNRAMDNLTAPEIGTILRTAKFPVVLRFRMPEQAGNQSIISDESGNENDSFSSEEEATPFASSYNLVWQGGDLGLTFERVASSVTVKRILHGYARKSNLVLVGDTLVSINTRRIPEDQTFKVTMMQLLESKKPVILGFERDSLLFEDTALLGPTQF